MVLSCRMADSVQEIVKLSFLNKIFPSSLQMHFEGGCLTQLERDDDFYDVIYCREALHVLPRKQEVFAKFYVSYSFLSFEAT